MRLGSGVLVAIEIMPALMLQDDPLGGTFAPDELGKANEYDPMTFLRRIPDYFHRVMSYVKGRRYL
ncbi:hypothetical protein ANO14919_025770 [Xylariales sp. No.14919]|nr:hypothetical protein ANO14919_025770 [Xylariales sp. No.14919]